jgi:hypothetical protein
MKQELNWKRCVLSSFAVAAMLSVTAIDTARGDHAAAFVPKFEHAPADALDGIVEVELQADGTWGASKSESIFWRFMLGVENRFMSLRRRSGPP